MNDRSTSVDGLDVPATSIFKTHATGTRNYAKLPLDARPDLRTATTA